MRILIDLQSCQSGSRHGGIGRYSLSLAEAMARHAGNHEIWILLNQLMPDTIDPVREAFRGLMPAARIVAFQAPGPVAEAQLENQVRTRIAEYIREHFIAELRPDIVHVSSMIEGWDEDVVTSAGLLFPAERTAVTLYDLIPYFEQKKYLSNKDLKTFYFNKLEHIRNAGLLLAISDYSRQEGVSALEIPAERVINISSASSGFFGPRFVGEGRRLQLGAILGINRPFLMYTSSFDQRKNQAGLIEAFSLLPADMRDKYQLVIVGNGWEGAYAHLRKHAANRGLAVDQIVFTGRIDDEILLDLYNLCDLFVFPSFREGFGLPIIEAMSCGVPAIGSNTTSIPEVIGRDDALFDPTKPMEMAKKIYEVLTNHDFRNELKRHGLDFSRRFSWDKSAKLALEAMEESHAQALFSSRKKTGTALSSEGIDHNRKGYYFRLLTSLAELADKAPIDDALKEAVASATSLNMDFTSTIPHLPDHYALCWLVHVEKHNQQDASFLYHIAASLKDLGHKVVLHDENEVEVGMPYQQEINSASLGFDIAFTNSLLPNSLTRKAKLNLHYYSGDAVHLDADVVKGMNLCFDGIVCQTQDVKRFLINQSITTPILAIDAQNFAANVFNQTEDLPPLFGFTVLHFAFDPYLDGTDLAIDAFYAAYSGTPDIGMVIVTSSQKREMVENLLVERKGETDGALRIFVLTYESYVEAAYLIKFCQIVLEPVRTVAPRPYFADAQLAGVIVIRTGIRQLEPSGVTSTNTYNIDYVLERDRRPTGAGATVLMRPFHDELVTVLKSAYEQRNAISVDELYANKLKSVSESNSRRSAEACCNFIRSLNGPYWGSSIIGVVSTWNIRCGIARYCEELSSNFPVTPIVFAPYADAPTKADQSYVRRCWTADGEDDLKFLFEQIVATGVRGVIIQFNYGFFDFRHLNQLVVNLVQRGIVTILIMHSTKDHPGNPAKSLSVFKDALDISHRILVHSTMDLNRLKAINVTSNVTLFPHGIAIADPNPSHKHVPPAAFTLASYGFFLPGKGLLELIDAFNLLLPRENNLHLLMVNAKYSDPISDICIDEARKKIEELCLTKQITLVTDYLSDEDSLGWLVHADLIIYPYQATGESSSAAVRQGLASRRPVAVTPLSIFEDVDSVVFKLPDITPETMSNGIKEIMRMILDQSPVVFDILKAQENWIAEHDYRCVGSLLYNMTTALIQDNRHVG